MNSLWTFF